MVYLAAIGRDSLQILIDSFGEKTWINAGREDLCPLLGSL
jgi:hypothetical protein